MSRFAALAVAHRSANAVGAVAWTFGATGIVLELDGVRPHVRGFAFASESQHATLVVPYSALRGIVREGPVLLVSFDPKVLFPYNRFALVRFARELGPTFGRARRFGKALSLLSWLAPLVVALLAGWAYRRGLAGFRTLSMAGVAAAALAVTGLRVLRLRALWGGPSSDRLRDEFEQLLRQRLGLAPSDVRVTAAREPATIRHTLASFARPRWLGPSAIVALLGSLGAAVALKKYGIARLVRLPVSEVRQGLTAALPTLRDASKADVTPKLPTCTCERPDSTLWKEPPPKVALLAVPLRGDLDTMWLRPDVVYPVTQRGRDVIELDLAVVNGSTRPIDEVALVVTFWRRAGDDRRNVNERGLSWGRSLEPGRSVKWRVRGRGDALRVTSYLPKEAESGPYASPDAYASLLGGKLPAVRLYAATMLAYLGDARAESAARNLGVLSKLEEAQRTALLATQDPIVTCDIADGHACVVNGTGRLLRRVKLRDGDARTTVVDDLFFPGQGLRVDVAMATPPLRAEAAERDEASP
jgi:hypothetical protein